jgi:hypothetical protein
MTHDHPKAKIIHCQKWNIDHTKLNAYLRLLRSKKIEKGDSKTNNNHQYSLHDVDKFATKRREIPGNHYYNRQN